VLDHWFYCHAISTKLQQELGAAVVKDWVEKCNSKGIGEVVINDEGFATSRLWNRMLRLESHEYWLVQEPPRSEGYIAFADKVALISWNEKSCTLYDDKKLARTFRNDTKIFRLGAEIQPFCCEDHRMGTKANPDAEFYRRMWE